jgi:hypothetical protein
MGELGNLVTLPVFPGEGLWLVTENWEVSLIFLIFKAIVETFTLFFR